MSTKESIETPKVVATITFTCFADRVESSVTGELEQLHNMLIRVELPKAFRKHWLARAPKQEAVSSKPKLLKHQVRAGSSAVVCTCSAHSVPNVGCPVCAEAERENNKSSTLSVKK